MLIPLQIQMLQRAAQHEGQIQQILQVAVAMGDVDTILHIARNYNTAQHIANAEMRSELQQLMHALLLAETNTQHAN